MEQPVVPNGGMPQPGQGERGSIYQPQPGEFTTPQIGVQPERSAVGPETLSQQSAAAGQAYAVPVAPPQVQTVAQASAAQDTSTGHAPQLADDVDVIEKEWVDKAKQIVSATREDPRKQEFEVSVLQSDYLKKRYNKDVKVPED